MKTAISKEYIYKVRKILRSKLNGGNIISAINSRTASAIRYGAGMLDWAVLKLEDFDRKTRNLLTMHGAHHQKANIYPLFLKRKNGGTCLIDVKDCVKMEKCSLLKYIEDKLLRRKKY